MGSPAWYVAVMSSYRREAVRSTDIALPGIIDVVCGPMEEEKAEQEAARQNAERHQNEWGNDDDNLNW